MKNKARNIPLLRAGNQAKGAEMSECIDQSPVMVETKAGILFLKPIILVENGVIKKTKYCLRRTRKGMLRLE